MIIIKPIFLFATSLLIGALLQCSFASNDEFPQLASVKAKIAEQRNNPAIKDDLKQRGKQLLSAIEEALHHSAHLPNDASYVVSQYIPLGTSFEEAEVILRYAG